MGDPRPSVLHCFRPLVGGVFRHVRDLVHQQVAHGVDIGIVCDRGPGSPGAEAQLTELGRLCTLGVHRLPMSRAPNWQDLVNATRMSEIVGATGATILHGHGAKGGMLARMASVDHPVTRIYSPHGGVLHYDPRSLSGRLLHGVERRLLHRTDGLVFVCQHESERFRAVIGGAVTPRAVVYNGLHEGEWDPPDRSTSTPAEFDFVFVGELRELKGIVTLCHAVHRLCQSRPVRLLIVGDGPDAAALRALVVELGLGGHVTFGPPVARAVDAFRRGRCVVVPSHAEALPYVVLEAVAAARPVVATDVGGIPEIFGHRSSQLVAPGDAEALARRLGQVAADPASATADAMALAAQARHRFAVETMAADMWRFYAEAGQRSGVGNDRRRVRR